MSKARNVLTIIILNIFLTLLVSVMLEYVNLSERFTGMEDNVTEALDLALLASTASEELFSFEYLEQITSGGWTYQDKDKTVSSSLNVFRNGRWYQGNAYVLAKYYYEYGDFPPNEGEYQSYADSASVDAVYRWLFGHSGERYSAEEFTWGNQSFRTVLALADADINESDCLPNDEFKAFYENIGKEIKMRGTVKVKESAEDFHTGVAEFPTLWNMGLAFTGAGGTFTAGGNEILTDNFCMSAHAGKNRGIGYSAYYITPYSLGITYVPTKVLRPIFIANLDTIIRLEKLSSANLRERTIDEANAVLASVDGCVEPNVYAGLGLVRQQHINEDDHTIINDGNVEYDLDSTQVKVDYMLVDFYNPTYREVVSRVEGAMSGYTTAGGIDSAFSSDTDILNKTVDKLKASDTNKGYTNGNRIVAKVTVRMKVYVQYQSSILQWSCYRNYDGAGDLHYAIKTWDSQSGELIRDEDGTWFQYSTYFAVTR